MRAIAATLLAGLALALAACGGSGTSGGAGGEAPARATTKAEFIAKTDAQCKVSNARTRQLNAQVRAIASSAQSDEDLLRRLAPLLERSYGQVRDNAAAFEAVNPPVTDAPTIERIRKLYDKQAELVRKLGAAAKSRNVDAFKTLSEEQKGVVRDARRAARQYGFKECGSTKSDAA